MPRTLLTVLAFVAAALGLAGVAVAASGGTAITRGRLERSVGSTFGRVYAREAALQGHQGVTPATLRTRVYCDKGPGVVQSGPGAGWNCLAAWRDPNGPMPSTGYGKLEVNVHTNGCYTASAPSSLVGYLTITDARGRSVPNPAYEFDACLDPDTDPSPTGVRFPPELKITSTAAVVAADATTGIDLACGPGAGGCTGVIEATAGGRSLGSRSFHLTEQATDRIGFLRPVPAGASEVELTVHSTHGIEPSATALPVQR